MKLLKTETNCLRKPKTRYLGLGIAGLTILATDIIKGDSKRVEILKFLSEVSQDILRP